MPDGRGTEAEMQSRCSLCSATEGWLAEGVAECMVGLHSAPISAKPGPTSGQADAWTGGLRVREVSRRPPLPAKPFPRPVQIAASAESFRFLQPRDETPRRNGPGRSYFLFLLSSCCDTTPRPRRTTRGKIAVV